MNQLLIGYDFGAVEGYTVEELRKQIDEKFKALGESIKELKESNSRIANHVK